MTAASWIAVAQAKIRFMNASGSFYDLHSLGE